MIIHVFLGVVECSKFGGYEFNEESTEHRNKN